mmetsp:Transcript_73388/g.172430  ORF Transcript_73388/g.172430 Transcript_73388/m.172430 type:complete len:202 (+) Transcript_73388:1081-1686(+)
MSTGEPGAVGTVTRWRGLSRHPYLANRQSRSLTLLNRRSGCPEQNAQYAHTPHTRHRRHRPRHTGRRPSFRKRWSDTVLGLRAAVSRIKIPPTPRLCRAPRIQPLGSRLSLLLTLPTDSHSPTTTPPRSPHPLPVCGVCGVWRCLSRLGPHHDRPCHSLVSPNLASLSAGRSTMPPCRGGQTIRVWICQQCSAWPFVHRAR